MGGPLRPPGVYFETIGEAWKLLQQEMPTWIAGMLLMFGANFVLSSIASLTLYGPSLRPMPGNSASAGQWVLYSIVCILNGAISSALMGGLYHMGARQARGERIQVTDAFAGFRKLGAMVSGYILYTLAILVGLVLCFVPGFFAIGALAFTFLIIIEQDVSGPEAISRSYQALKGHAWAMFGLVFVAGLLASLGVCACGIGLLFTYPIFLIVIGMHYNYFFPPADARGFGPGAHSPMG